MFVMKINKLNIFVNNPIFTGSIYIYIDIYCVINE